MGRTESGRRKVESESLDADCKDSGHFSSEGRTRDYWLVEQGRRPVCRSCGEGRRDTGRGGYSGVIGTNKERKQEQEFIQYETGEENCNFLRKKCSCGKCADK